jgi:hypothetical protein
MLKMLGFWLFLAIPVFAQDGYVGYHLSERGSPDSVLYETSNTNTNVSTTNPPPDVFLNASVHVGEIDIQVNNLTAKINLAAQVLSLLKFNAGVDASIDKVQLLIQNVTAKVTLEARLANLVLMIGDVLDSLDLNPILATLGNDISSITNATTGAIGDLTSGLSSRSVDSEDYNLLHNILYSINDYSGNTHTNRILAQNGDIVEQSLDNDGNVHGEKTVGSYKTDMSPNGYTLSTTYKGQQVEEVEYTYSPFPGLMVVSAIYLDSSSKVVGTQVLAESSAGGSSTIASDEDLK